ncbi:RNA polymerase sigma-70 factor [Mangrovibacterium marinum]|uniref:RNA polymerase sigma-70 factor (ECF subfamily) n=1 Tax=Mangrovibacterium marinum TaxID=1639118 RepID=A0A2T5C6E9_9BACT|nr:RNA polymerase sigma-70 factor [Mangrovibacterium marinum]PTN10525.1 RNA polymerase sigma-70 factor (ECF subfamily) [Mangrovibacterium marinum]
MPKHKFDISSPDHVLLLELKEGNSKAFDLIFRRYYDNLCRLCYSFIHDADTSQNLVQNVFIKLWERRFVMDKVSNLGGYLTVMVKNQIADYISDYKKHQIDSEFNTNIADYSTENEIQGREFEERLTISLAKLPPRCKQAFELSRFENLSNKEIAVKMKISVKGVEALIGRSLKLLRVELSEFLPSSKISSKNPILFFLRIARNFSCK